MLKTSLLKQRALFIVLLMAGWFGVAHSAQAFQLLLLDARSAAMGGVGVASDPRNAVFHNPSLLATNDEPYDWYAYVPSVSQAIGDPDDLETGLNQFISAANKLDNSPNNPNAAAAADALSAINNTTYREREVFSLQAAIPSANIAGAAYLHRYQINASKANVGSFDLTTDLANPDYASTIEHRGIKVLEIGVSAGKPFYIPSFDLGTYKFGGSFKLMLLDGIGYEEPVESSSLQFNEKGHVERTSAFNVDLGVSKEWGVWKFGLAVKNLLSKDVALGDSGEQFTISPQVRTGFAYRSRRTYLEFDVDLTQSEQIGLDSKSMLAGLGWEYNLVSWLYLRAGYQQDLQGENLATGTYGLGIQIAGFEIEAGGMASEDENSLFAQIVLKI
jgi:hypothetical protein